MTLPDFTFWQGTILFSLGFLAGGTIGGLVFEAVGFRRGVKIKRFQDAWDETLIVSTDSKMIDAATEIMNAIPEVVSNPQDITK